MTRGGTSTAAPSAAQEESPTAPPPRLPFYAAGDIVAGDAGFARVHGRKMRRLEEAVEVTRAGVAHGYGTIARRRVARGECFVDPCAVARGGAPAAADARGGRVVVAETEADDCYFRVRDDVRAAPTFYLNEARGGEEPNVEWRVVALGRPALAWVLLRDVAPGEELLVAYDA